MGFRESLAAGDVVLRGHMGDDVTYSLEGEDPVEVKGIFDALYERVDPRDPGVSSFGPAVFHTLADLPGNPVEDSDDVTLTILGDDYTVHEAQPDGMGAVILQLHKT